MHLSFHWCFWVQMWSLSCSFSKWDFTGTFCDISSVSLKYFFQLWCPLTAMSAWWLAQVSLEAEEDNILCSYLLPISMCSFMWEEGILWMEMVGKWACEFLRTAKPTWFFLLFSPGLQHGFVNSSVCSQNIKECFLLWQGHPSNWPREASSCGGFGF